MTPVRVRSRNRFTPRLERFENRNLLSLAPMMEPLSIASPKPAPTHAALPTASQEWHVVGNHHHKKEHDRHDHDGEDDGCGCGKGGGGGVGGLPFNCARVGTYNFAIVTITNNATTTVNFKIQAQPCPGTFVNWTLNPGQTQAFYTHFPATGFTPSFQVNLGGLNLFSPTPNIIAMKQYPQFVNQITPSMGSQYQILQTSPGAFVLLKS
jgi:hypothetical protein